MTRHRQDGGRVGAACRKQRQISWLDPSGTDNHLLAHITATAVLLVALAALAISLLIGPRQPSRPTRVSHVAGAHSSLVKPHTATSNRLRS